MIAALLLLADPVGADADWATAQERLSGATRCRAQAADEVTVCARRRADRFRVPLIEHEPGDPRYESVAAERQRWLARTTPLAEHSPFLVGGGSLGVHATLVPGGGGPSVRPLAP